MTDFAKLWQHHDARLYITGQALSDAADFALIIAVGIWTRMLTGSSSAAALTFFMLALGSLAGPLGGALADRLRRLPLLVATNLSTACVVALLLFVRSSGELLLVYFVMFSYGLSGAVIAPAQSALLKKVVPSRLLAEANMTLETARGAMRLVAPLLGTGILVTLALHR